jgi:F-type H+-transporting ATPase subunit gamma
MPSTQEFRRRIKSVNNTKQITKAMQMIASIKMQKAVKTIRSARSYIQSSWNILGMLAKLTSPEKHPLLQSRPVKKIGVIVITSDRGLCGSYNTNILNKALSYAKGEIKLGVETDVIADLDLVSIGQKGTNFIKTLPKGELLAEFTGFGKEIEFEETKPIAKLMIDEYISGKYDQVVVIYSHFESPLKQTPVVKQILPITKDHIDIPELWEKSEEQEKQIEYKFEPNPDAILERILNQFIRMQIFGAVLESNASEHSARMFAMQSATDNASDLISELQLVYNTVRQGNITREIAEISGAAEAMK